MGNDGSSDTGIDKMNPLTIKIFDVNNSETVTNHFFSMCLTEGEDCCKAYKIFEAIENAFDEDSIPWYNCVSLTVDNTNTMIGRKNSVASKVIEKNEEIFISGCPCHLAHIAASHANDSFSTHLGLNVEDVCVDLFYWFDKSCKRKGKLLEYSEFCDQEYQSVLKHLSVRWLSLECCLDRVVRKLPSLRAYFLSEDFADARFQRLNTWFSNKLLEPALMFQNAAIPIFTNFNLLLQRDEPCIHLLKPSIENFGRRIANRIIKPHAMQNISTVSELDFDDEPIFKDKKDLFLGGITKATLNRLLSYGDISDTDYDKFYDAVFYYYKDSLAYVIKKFPIQNELVCNAVWVDVEKKA